jgi:hypothetical protein
MWKHKKTNLFYIVCNMGNKTYGLNLLVVHWLLQPHFWKSVRMKLTLLKWGLGSPLRFPKLQSSIVGVKTPRLGVLFISLENYQSVDVENGLAWLIWRSVAQIMAKRKAGSQTCQFDFRPLKVGNRPNLDACRWSATHYWKALDESYKFALDHTPIGGLSKTL